MMLIVAPSGSIRAIYSEDFDYLALGHPMIRRASHVEPDECGVWHADLGPVGGPVLGPFHHRSQALAAEISWLESHALPVPTPLAQGCPVDR
jgi:hypothetical protein